MNWQCSLLMGSAQGGVVLMGTRACAFTAHQCIQAYAKLVIALLRHQEFSTVTSAPAFVRTAYQSEETRCRANAALNDRLQNLLLVQFCFMWTFARMLLKFTDGHAVLCIAVRCWLCHAVLCCAVRCGKVLSVGHARHLETCNGPPEPPTEEEIAAKVRKQGASVLLVLRRCTAPFCQLFRDARDLMWPMQWCS